MKKIISYPHLGFGLFFATPYALFLQCRSLLLFLFSLSSILYAERGGGEMGVTFTFDPISLSSTFDYTNARDFKSLHFSNESFSGIDLGKEGLHNCDFTNDINAIVMGATTNFRDDYNKCFFVYRDGTYFSEGKGALKTGFSSQITAIEMGGTLYAEPDLMGAINFGSTRRPTSWLNKNGIRYTSGIDNFNDNKEYLSLNYLDLKTNSSASSMSGIKIIHEGTDSWNSLYPLAYLRYFRDYSWTTKKDTTICGEAKWTGKMVMGKGIKYGNFSGSDCRNLSPVMDPMDDGKIEHEGDWEHRSISASCNLGAEKKAQQFSCDGKILDQCNGWYDPITYFCTFVKVRMKETKKIDVPHYAYAYKIFQRVNQGTGYAGCEFLPHVGDNSEFAAYGDIFKDCYTHLRINSPFKDGDGNTIDYGIPHLDPKNTTRLSVTCLGTGRFVDNKIKVKRKDTGEEKEINYGRIEAPNGINQQVARLFCLESPKEVDGILEFQRFEIYLNYHIILMSIEDTYLKIEDNVAIIAVPERGKGCTIRIEAVYKVKEFDVAVQKYVKTDRLTHKYAGTEIPDSFHIKNVLLPSYNPDSIK